MSTRKWGPEGPPQEAYSSVTNAERFRPLHELALNLISRLEDEFDVDRVEGYGLDSEMEEGAELARPSVRLTPNGDSCAPITVVFTAFPGIAIRVCHWHSAWFPSADVMPVLRRRRRGFQNSTRSSKLLSQVVSGRGTSFPVSVARGCRESIGLIGRDDPPRVASIGLSLGRAMDEAIEWMHWKKSG